MTRTTEAAKKLVLVVVDHDEKRQTYEFHAPTAAFADMCNTFDHLRGHLALSSLEETKEREAKEVAKAKK